MKKVIVITLLILLTLGWWLILQPQPLVTGHYQLSQGDVGRLQYLLRIEPNSLQHRIALTDRDLNLLLQHTLQSSNPSLIAETHLFRDRSMLRATIDSQFFLRRYINLSLYFQSQSNQLVVLEGKIGGLVLPKPVMDLLLTLTMPYLQQQSPLSQLQTLLPAIKRIDIDDQWVAIDIRADKHLQTQLQREQLTFLLGHETLQRLPVYQAYLAQHFAEKAGRRLALSTALRQLFTYAQRQPSSKDPIADNKAIILSLFLHIATQRDFAVLKLGNAIQFPPKPIQFTLADRDDLAQHLLTTATITLLANRELADAMGLHKELQDKQGRSGFDVSDLMADQAGSLLANRLTQDKNTALELQQQLAAIHKEEDFFPYSLTFKQQLEQQLNRASHLSNQQLLEQLDQAIHQRLSKAKIYQ